MVSGDQEGGGYSSLGKRQALKFGRKSGSRGQGWEGRQDKNQRGGLVKHYSMGNGEPLNVEGGRVVPSDPSEEGSFDSPEKDLLEGG